MQYRVGDLVKLTVGPDKGTGAVVYEQYSDFEDSSKAGVSLITEVGKDLRGFQFSGATRLSPARCTYKL
jgi:hypothetical protein